MTAPETLPTSPKALGAAVVKKSRRKWPWVVGGVVALFFIIGIANGGSGTPNTAVMPSAVVPPPGTPTNGAAVLPKVAAPAAAAHADREGAFAVLTANIAHYRSVFGRGQAVIGRTRYANGEEGLTAMEDPNSAAARFRDYRKNPNPELDLSFQDAFGQADTHFTADNEPQAIRDWRDDMGTMQDDLGKWVQVAVDYQISSKSQADLDAAAAKVRQDLAKAEADARAVRRG